MAKPKKIVLSSDDQKRFGAEVFDLVRTKLAPAVGGNVNFGVKLAADHFAPRKPGEVTVVEMEDAIPQIAAKFQTESAPASNGGGRLPLNDEAQAAWDSGRWRGKLTVHGLRQRFAAEIKDGVDLTLSMLDAYVAELAAEKERIKALVDEKPDPDPIVAGKKMPCAASRHHGNNDPAELTQRYLLERGDDGELRRRKHGLGDGGYIVAGELLRVEKFDGEIPAAAGVIKIEESGRVIFGIRYCGHCRTEALEDFRARKELPSTDPNWIDRRSVLTFYTVAGLRLVTKREAESASQVSRAREFEGSAGARTFGGGYGTRKDRDWRRSRGAKR